MNFKTSSLLICTALSALSTALIAQQDTNYDAPRTQWGQPDLQGVWNFTTEVPLQRSSQYGDRQFLTAEEVAEIQAEVEAALNDTANEPDPDLAERGVPEPGERFVFGYDNFWYENVSIGEALRTSRIYYPENGRMPRVKEGAPVSGSGFLQDTDGERPVRFTVGGIGKDGPEDRGLSERCIVGMNEMPPHQPNRYNNNIQIVQNRDHVVMLSEMNHNARIIRLENNAPLTDDIRLWTGDSIGYWEGDTLVIETRNFNGMSHSFGSFGTSWDKKLIERLTRIDDNTITYDWTLEDPSTFTDKISAITTFNKTSGQIYEYACQEGNYGLLNVLRGEREAERRAAESE